MYLIISLTSRNLHVSSITSHCFVHSYNQHIISAIQPLGTEASPLMLDCGFIVQPLIFVAVKPLL